MDNELKRDLLDRGLTESEADFLINKYGDREFNSDDLTISDNAEAYLINELEWSDINTSEYPGRNVVRLVDADAFVDEMAGDGVMRLPSGRIVRIYFWD